MIKRFLRFLNIYEFFHFFDGTREHIEIEEVRNNKSKYSVFLTKSAKKILKEATGSDNFVLKITQGGFSQSSSNTNTFELSTIDGDIIGYFGLSGFHGCCGVCIMSGVYVCNEYRLNNIGYILNELAEKIAKSYNYGAIICINQDRNKAEDKILTNKKWSNLFSFINPKSSNLLNIHIKSLNQ